MAFTLPAAALRLRRPRPAHVEGDARVPPRQAPQGLSRRHDADDRGHANTPRMPIEEIVKKSYSDNPKLFNQAGQYYNHVHFWKWMKPSGGGKQAARQAGGADQQRPRLVRRVPHQVHRCRQDAVRLGLGVACAEGRQARRA